ncbi:MAG: hypothetical protein K5666_03680 [Bacilli bacterium]|nr:hypothetical protein [Bacilli bacterium]
MPKTMSAKQREELAKKRQQMLADALSKRTNTLNNTSYADKVHEEVRQVEQTVKEQDEQLKEVLNGEDARTVNNYGLNYLHSIMDKDAQKAEKEAALKAGNDFLNQIQEKKEDEHEAAVKAGEEYFKKIQEQKEREQEEIRKEKEESARRMVEMTRNIFLPSFNEKMEKFSQEYDTLQKILENVNFYDENTLFEVKSSTNSTLGRYNRNLSSDYFKDVPEFDAQYKNIINECIKIVGEIDKKASDKLYAIVIEDLQRGLNQLDNFFMVVKERNGISYEGALKNMTTVDNSIQNHKNKIDKFMQVLSPEQALEVNRLGNEIINRFLLMKKYSIESINAHNQQQGIGDEGEQQQGGRKI